MPASHVVYCGDKSTVDADVLIDDSAYRFLRFRGQKLLFDARHNADQTDFQRVRGWSDVARLFLDEAVAASDVQGCPQGPRDWS